VYDFLPFNSTYPLSFILTLLCIFQTHRSHEEHASCSLVHQRVLPHPPHSSYPRARSLLHHCGSNSGNASSGSSMKVRLPPAVAPRQRSGGRSVSSPFLDTKTVTSGTSEGSGESIRVSTLPIPRSLRVRYERSRGQRRCFRFQHESGPNGIPHGGSAFTSGSFKAGVPRPEWG
jgi:hypothetical protein